MINFVILCGGSGSRLWPKSREKLPKQFLSLTNDFTMLQNTIKRIKTIQDILEITKSNIYIICNKDHYHIVELQLQTLNLYDSDSDSKIIIISEPKGRDSGPAICISALVSLPEDFTFIMPCDHVFNDLQFTESCKESIQYLNKSIITFGITPKYIETGYGYIKTNENMDTIDFIEKPNFENAKKYFEDKSFLWNAGIFAFQNQNMLDCFNTYAPDILKNCENTISKTNIINNNLYDLFELSSDYFTNCRSISIDYAIMEPLCKDLYSKIGKKTIPYNGHWNDIGSYQALYNELEKDENGNYFKGNVTNLLSKNCYVDSKKSIVATINIENLIVVDTEDVLLICNKDNSQMVKNIVNIFKPLNSPELEFHQTVLRPWGSYTILDGNDNCGYKVKRISVYPGKRLSLQSHNHRSEHWVIAKGNAKVLVDNEIKIMKENEYVFIPLKTLHRIENIGTELLEFIETQIGNYLGEDDIIRYEDDFRRI